MLVKKSAGVGVLVALCLLSGCSSEASDLKTACDWWQKGSDALSNQETTSTVYFQKSADIFSKLANENPEKYGDAYVAAEKWASGTNFSASDISTSFKLSDVCRTTKEN